jgi:regulator of sigma E protease
MRVERFALFFPPMLFTVRRGETEYGVGAIPLGGYVRISGMNPNEELSPEVAPRAYYAQPPWKRIFVILGGPARELRDRVRDLRVHLRLPRRPGDHERGRVHHEGHAAVGALELGDRIVAVDGVSGSPEVLREQLATHRCAGEPRQGCRATRPAELTVVRDGRRRWCA